MSASEHVNEVLFHGTSKKFKAGDIILPPEKSGAESNWYWLGSRVRKNAFATPELGEAKNFAKTAHIHAKNRSFTEEGVFVPKKGIAPRVYEVEPVNPESVKSRQSTYGGIYGGPYKFSESFSPEGFRVIRRVWIGRSK